MEETNLTEQALIISQPDNDPFEYLVEHIDLSSNKEDAGTFRRLEINSMPES